MQRHVILAKTILELIQNLDGDGCGISRTEFYKLIKNSFELPDGGDLITIVDYHLHLLETEGLVLCEQDGEDGSGSDLFLLTWSGHDFIESNVI